ncbi:Daunorubicin/doxorubicin resistance ATP-binding protein DrrA [Microbacterium lemovicicum]|uniref:Daunorubicin/doxorubicin resistance ATP-binding protein DrrA n=1 Tax=Microbacterium lemovicicum TaxID=1072463 RepID=A0A3Q9J2N4_9MICO|nr:ABC transporter ATP-binding protein [Microbacterium lemovicicum]AZS37160.1 Daunorubicin/doxorubicin resistance ATP-binding protein DrrA [Microbacterium lemovicicum]
MKDAAREVEPVEEKPTSDQPTVDVAADTPEPVNSVPVEQATTDAAIVTTEDAAVAAHPGPPPPLPPDLRPPTVPAGLVIPPRPPLPVVQPQAEDVDTESAAGVVADAPGIAGEAEPAEVAPEDVVVEKTVADEPESPVAENPADDAVDDTVAIRVVAAEPEPDLEQTFLEESPFAEPIFEEPDLEEPIVDEPMIDEPDLEEPILEELEADDLTTDVDTEDAASVPVVEPDVDTGTPSDVDEATDLADPSAVEESSAAAAVVFDRDETDVETDVDGAVLRVRGITKVFGETRAVDGIDLTVPAGTFYGLVGPNGAGKTTTLSMIAGLLRPDRGSIEVNGIDAKTDPVGAKRAMGVLPDRLRTFDRLTGRQLLYYYGILRKLPPSVVESRTADLARAFDLTDALGRVVSDYSAGMAKKVMLAGAMIHSPRLLVLDEPFEAVDPVSSAVILDILGTYVAHGGTVILSSHGMDLVERVCSRVAVIVAGQVLAEGTVDEVRGELTLEQRFIELAGGLSDVEGLEWLHTFSD